MKVMTMIRVINLRKNKIYTDVSIVSSDDMNKEKCSYRRKRESCGSKNTVANFSKINFYDFEVQIKTKYIKHLFCVDYDKTIKVTEFCNTNFGSYYYCREIKKLSDSNIKRLKNELDYIKNGDFKSISDFSGECILSPNIVVQLIERLAFSLSEWFMIDNITFSCVKNRLFDNNISLIDVPLLFHGNHHRRYDDELMRTKKKYIVRNGYVTDNFSGLNLGFSQYGNTYCDELTEEEKMTFSNLHLKIPLDRCNSAGETNIYFYDSVLPLKIDLFNGTIKGRLIGIDKKTNEKIVSDFSSNYKDLFDSMRRVGRYTICNGHKVSKVKVTVGGKKNG